MVRAYSNDELEENVDELYLKLEKFAENKTDEMMEDSDG